MNSPFFLIVDFAKLTAKSTKKSIMLGNVTIYFLNTVNKN